MARSHSSDIARNVLEDDLQEHIRHLAPVWQDVLETPAAHQALLKLRTFLTQRRDAGAEIYPGQPFRALQDLQPDAVRVIILGQDPYHGPNQAQGLAFSVPDICPCPPSLRNIFKELALEYPEHATPQSHNLARWAQQGVLLLNTVLTVESRQPGSHAKKGWEIVTDHIIQRVARSAQPKVFMFWGAHAQSKQALIPTGPNHAPTLVLTANHPSPLSAQRPPKPFIGCQHFIQANSWLHQHRQPEIDWLGEPGAKQTVQKPLW
ncbi:MAG TPA: uracil-DNA glycosylase [Eoetvoesiella sp.]